MDLICFLMFLYVEFTYRVDINCAPNEDIMYKRLPFCIKTHTCMPFTTLIGLNQTVWASPDVFSPQSKCLLRTVRLSKAVQMSVYFCMKEQMTAAGPLVWLWCCWSIKRSSVTSGSQDLHTLTTLKIFNRLFLMNGFTLFCQWHICQWHICPHHLAYL